MKLVSKTSLYCVLMMTLCIVLLVILPFFVFNGHDFLDELGPLLINSCIVGAPFFMLLARFGELNEPDDISRYKMEIAFTFVSTALVGAIYWMMVWQSRLNHTGFDFGVVWLLLISPFFIVFGSALFGLVHLKQREENKRGGNGSR